MFQVSVAFFLLDSVKDQLLGIPWSLWSIFVVEQRHGFNKQTPLLFFSDQLKQVCLPPLVPVTDYALRMQSPIDCANTAPEEMGTLCRLPWLRCSYRPSSRGSPGFC